MEGNVYECIWKKAKSKYRITLKEDGSVFAEAGTFDEAAESLCERIATLKGDGEAALQFDPLPPLEHRLGKWAHPEILVLGYNEAIDTSVREAGIYLGGHCQRCGSFVGGRSSQNLKVSGSIRGVLASARGSSPIVLIASGAFVELLDSSERTSLGLRPTTVAQPSRARFYELTGPAIAACVSFKDAKYHPITNWWCPDCQSRRLYPTHPELAGTAIQDFVCADDLPSPLPSSFMIGSAHDGMLLCMTQTRWKELAGHPGLKGILPHRIGAVRSSAVERNPKLRSV